MFGWADQDAVWADLVAARHRGLTRGRRGGGGCGACGGCGRGCHGGPLAPRRPHRKPGQEPGEECRLLRQGRVLDGDSAPVASPWRHRPRVRLEETHDGQRHRPGRRPGPRLHEAGADGEVRRRHRPRSASTPAGRGDTGRPATPRNPRRRGCSEPVVHLP